MALNSFRAAPGSWVKSQTQLFNTPLLGFASGPRECATSRWEFLGKNFSCQELNSCQEYYQEFAFWQDSRREPCRGDFYSQRDPSEYRFFGRILAEIRDRNFFPEKIPPLWKTGRVGGISILLGSQRVPGILLGS